MKNPKRLIIALTGASGMPIAVSFLKKLASRDVQAYGIISASGNKVLELETGLTAADLAEYVAGFYDERDFAAPLASGSFPNDGMVIIPCTMGTLGAIANGMSTNLIHRAADVTLKEGRKLLIVARETPLNRIHLANMLRLSEAGATIMPAMPGFYHRPRDIQELVGDFAERILDNLGLPDPNARRWSGI